MKTYQYILFCLFFVFNYILKSQFLTKSFLFNVYFELSAWYMLTRERPNHNCKHECTRSRFCKCLTRCQLYEHHFAKQLPLLIESILQRGKKLLEELLFTDEIHSSLAKSSGNEKKKTAKLLTKKRS